MELSNLQPAYTHKIVLEDGTGICVEDILEIRKLL